jgi:hypothetical protein
VQARWDIPDTGEASEVRTLVNGQEVVRRFIPSRLEDNPYLSETDYRTRLQQLPDMERRALLDGRWDVIDIEGSIFNEEMQAAFVEGRICEIPVLDKPVQTFWDIGHDDKTAIWFHQQVGMEHRFIDYYEARQEKLPHYIHKLQELAQERGYVYDRHYLPHDADDERLTGDSPAETLRAYHIGDVEVVPRISYVRDGIEMMRAKFPSCYFDKYRCKDGIKALTHYRREWDEKLQRYRDRPLHDWASDAADALRQFAQGYMERSNFHRPMNYKPKWVV